MILFLQKNSFLLVCLFWVPSCISINLGKPYSPQLVETTIQPGQSYEKLLFIDLRGEITNISEDSLLNQSVNTIQQIVSRLQLATQDNTIKAILLRIDSPGGSVTASETLYHEIRKFRKYKQIPIYAYVMNVAASGGYYAAIACNEIFAPNPSILGSVGAIYFKPQISELSKKIGVEVNVIKSGKHKDMSSMFRESSKEENKIMQQMIDSMAETFLSKVIFERKINNEEKIKTIKTARIFLAHESLELGLIDKVATLDETVKHIVKKDFTNPNKVPQIISYKHLKTANNTIYSFGTSSHTNYESLLNNLHFKKLLQTYSKQGFYYLAL